MLPNLFTLSSVFCGLYAIIQLMPQFAGGSSDFSKSCIAVFFGAFFDMLDGRVARLTHTQSNFGMQLDSLADMVTFGVTPALIIYTWQLSELGPLGLFAAFAYVSCGAIRLAKFNVQAQNETKAMSFFIGLPIPLGAAVLVSSVLIHQRSIVLLPATLTPYTTLALTLLTSALMISTVRYRTFKQVRASPRSLIALCAILTSFVCLALWLSPSIAAFSFFTLYVGYGILECAAQRCLAYSLNK